MAIKIPLRTVRRKEISGVSFSSYEGISLIRLGPYLYDSTFIIFVGPISKSSHIEDWGFDIDTGILEGHHSVHKILIGENESIKINAYILL